MTDWKNGGGTAVDEEESGKQKIRRRNSLDVIDATTHNEKDGNRDIDGNQTQAGSVKSNAAECTSVHSGLDEKAQGEMQGTGRREVSNDKEGQNDGSGGKHSRGEQDARSQVRGESNKEQGDTSIKEATAKPEEGTSKRKRRSGWSKVPVEAKPAGGGFSNDQSGFSGPAPKADPSGDHPNAFATVVAGDAALQTSRLHLLAQQMGLSPDHIKAARELYVGNIPPQIEVPALVEFLNAALTALKGNTLPGQPAIKGWRATEGHFAFIEFRTMEEANNGLILNGINCLGYSLRIGRPKTYPEALNLVAAAQQGTLPATSGVTNGILTGVSLGTTVNKDLLGSAFSEASSRLDGPIVTTTVGSITPPPDALCMKNLPPPFIFPEEKMRELLTAFGALKFFLHFGLPSRSCMEKTTRHYLGVKDDFDVYGLPATADKTVDQSDDAQAASVETSDTASEPEKKKRLIELCMEDIESQPYEQAICFFEYHNPLDSQSLADQVETLKLCGIRPILEPAEKQMAPTSSQPDYTSDLKYHEILRLLVHHQMRKVCGPALRANALPMPVPTRCLFFEHLLTSQQLVEETEYTDILEDVRSECKMSGRVISIEIPRPIEGVRPSRSSDIGHCFVEFSTVTEACRARKALNGRRFCGRIAKAEWMSERAYLNRDFSSPQPNTDPQNSTTFCPELASHVPSMLRQMEEMERAGREAARAAATAAANASFSSHLGGVRGLTLTPVAALMDVPKPNFDEDVVKEEEEMEMDED